jgi:hypothetical protein
MHFVFDLLCQTEYRIQLRMAKKAAILQHYYH